MSNSTVLWYGSNLQICSVEAWPTKVRSHIHSKSFNIHSAAIHHISSSCVLGSLAYQEKPVQCIGNHGINPKNQNKAEDEVTFRSRFAYLLKNSRLIRDLDQVHADLRSSKHLAQHKAAKPAEDLPGLGRHYCVECAKWFEGENSLVQHRKGKNHKRRLCSLHCKAPTEQHDSYITMLTALGFGLFARSHTPRKKRTQR